MIMWHRKPASTDKQIAWWKRRWNWKGWGGLQWCEKVQLGANNRDGFDTTGLAVDRAKMIYRLECFNTIMICFYHVLHRASKVSLQCGFRNCTSTRDEARHCFKWRCGLIGEDLRSEVGKTKREGGLGCGWLGASLPHHFVLQFHHTHFTPASLNTWKGNLYWS